jgi:5'-deoxynucleotidase YfbR-like HD superfamily hydrolase
VLVEAIASRRDTALDRRWRLAALLHDAPEYVVGDMISPFKAALGIDYKAFEMRLLAAIHIRFGLPTEIPEKIAVQIKAADKAAAFLEATQLAGFSTAEALKFFGRPHGLAGPGSEQFLELVSQTPDEASTRYLARFRQLS